MKYFSLAVVIAATGFTVAVIASGLLSLQPGYAAGLLSGGLTSSPTLAAAQEAIRSGQIMPPEGLSKDGMIGNIATGYAITYIFGLAGLIGIIKLLPQILRIDLKKESKALETGDEAGSHTQTANIALRAYRVTNEAITKIPREQLNKQYWDKTSVVRLKRRGVILKPTLQSIDYLQLGDEVHILAPIEYFAETISKIDFGEELTPKFSTSQYNQTAQIVVGKKQAIRKSLGDVDLARTYGLILTRVTRFGIEVPITTDCKLHRGDIITVAGPYDNIDLLGQEIGHVEREDAETDIVTISLGIVFGVIIGLVAVNVGQLSIGLGSAGGLLASGLAIGYLRSVHPTFGRLPDAARWVLMEFGLLLFMAAVGLRAGGDIIETFIAAGPSLVVAGIFVTAIPVMAGYFFGRKVLRINPALLFGAITGSMTSGASLSVVTSAANSSVPSLGYTGAYAFANVLLTIAGSIILFF